MSLEKKLAKRTIKRALRVRKKIKATGQLRVSVFRSLKHIYAQIIDDAQSKTLVSFSSLDLEGAKGNKRDIAQSVGKELAKKALSKGVTAAVLDRGPFLFHGRVMALAKGLEEGGLKI